MPDKKAKRIADLLSEALFGISVTESRKSHTCVRCGKEAERFRDQLSEEEYQHSGLCQECQDWAFAPPPEEGDGKV